MADDEQGAAEVRAFLIADVRGYTLFTQERGDEAAARLAARFAEVVRGEVESRGGTLVELRGDEALVAFASPRQAVRAAVELQRRFVEEALADSGLALLVGIGLDAGEAVRVDGGFRGGALNLAALPPNFDGYEPYCPYTQDPTESGRWQSPDLAKARALVRASQTAGMPVTIWATYSGGADPKTIAAEAVAALRKLGYRASLHFVEDLNKFVTQTSRSSSQPRAALRGWGTDYPAASGFIAPQFTCNAFAPHDAGNYNVAEFCDRKIDALIEQARTLEATDPAAAPKLWARIDRALVEQAPYVPLFNGIALDVLSERVGNYQRHPIWGVLLDRMWVQ